MLHLPTGLGLRPPLVRPKLLYLANWLACFTCLFGLSSSPACSVWPALPANMTRHATPSHLAQHALLAHLAHGSSPGYSHSSHSLAYPRTLASASWCNSCWSSELWPHTPDGAASDCSHSPLARDSSSVVTVCPRRGVVVLNLHENLLQ